MEDALFILGCALFVASGVCGVAAVIVFVKLHVPDAVRFLARRPKVRQGKTVMKASGCAANAAPMESLPTKPIGMGQPGLDEGSTEGRVQKEGL
ncbi:MAG: hypothetical protein HFJ65_02600 [Eggerthellaceae bacterium]|nr:hypothetical protein [Eggerthellaceae bacterium]